MLSLSRACVALSLAYSKAHEFVTSDGLRGGAGGDVGIARNDGEAIRSDNEEEARAIGGINDEVNTEDKGLEISQSNDCPYERSIAFAVTVIEGTHVGDELWIDDYSRGSPQTVYLLKNVRFCGAPDDEENYVIRGTKIATAEEYKSEVAAYLAENGLEAVIYNMHGYSVDPDDSFNLHSYKWKEFYQEATGMLFIPVMWRTAWEYNGASALHDWNCPAIRSGKLFAANADAFKGDYPTHVMTHSMGNWVYYNFALELAKLGNSEIIFENHYMVAAAVRVDVFADGFNPDAPRAENEKVQEQKNGYSRQKTTPEKQIGISLQDDYDSSGWMHNWECFYDRETAMVLHETTAVDITECMPTDQTLVPVEECEPNGGYALTKAANHIHVVWSDGDSVLGGFGEAVQSFLGVLGPPELSQMIGRHGSRAEEFMNLQYFNERVTFHDVSGLTRVNHGYQMEYVAANIYDPLLQEDCHETGCDAEVCEAPYNEVWKDYCTFSFRYREMCCRFYH